MADITSISANERTIEIEHPATGEPVGLRWTLRPDTHPEVRKVQRQNLDKQLNSKKGKMTAAQIEANSAEILVAATAGWEWYGDLTFEEKKPELSADNVRRVLKKVPWIRQQVRQEFDNAEAFYEG